MLSAAMPPSCRRSSACCRRPARAPASVEPTGHAVRMDALHLIRAAAEFADTIERDAQNASAAQLGKTEEEVTPPPGRPAGARGRHRALPAGERASARRDAERRAERVARAARQGSCRRDPRAPGGGGQGQPPARAVAPPGDRAHERRPRRGRADARVGARQAAAVLARAQQGAEQLLAAAGLGQDAIGEVADAIMRAAEQRRRGKRTRSRRAAFAGPTEGRPCRRRRRSRKAGGAAGRRRGAVRRRSRRLAECGRVFGPRTVVEAAFIVAVPVIALEADS